MDYAIEISQLTLSYGKKPALDDISIDLNENRLIGLIGKNGSGKTTLMKLCAGLLEPSKGSVRVFQESPVDNLKILTDVIYSFPSIPHRGKQSLSQIIQTFTMFYPKFDTIFAYKLLEHFSLNKSMKYQSLSQGMTSTFNFICALSTRAGLTLLDEPILGMDVTVRKRIYEILLRDYMEIPRTIIISSHILSEMDEILSELLLIDSGKVVLYKEMDEIRGLAYRIDGTAEQVKGFSANRKVIYQEHKSIGSYAVIEDQCDEEIIKEGKAAGLAISKVSPEDYYIYKTNHGRGLDIECLWEKQTLAI